MTASREYLVSSQGLLQEGEEALAGGDLRQASEKLWGAAAQAVKRAAEERGLGHDSHAPLFQVIEELVRERGDGELRTLFAMAHLLHINFYENWLAAEAVAEGARWVRELVDRMERILLRRV